MKFKKITAAFEADNIFLAEELICHIFFSATLTGVICQIPLEEPDEGFGTQTLNLPDQTAIVGYLPHMDTSDIILEAIGRKLKELTQFNIKTRFGVEIVDEEEWAEAWKNYFHVTRITDKIVIKPAWRDHDPDPGDIVIHLDPGMAFGTGTHPSTAMCIRMIEHFLSPGQRFLDVGTGSGILMIGAAKLGATLLLGIDTDPVAVRVANENLEKNQISPKVFDLACTTLDQLPESPYEIIAANIIAQVIVNILPDICKRLAPSGKAILSGIVQEQRARVLSALAQNQLKIHQELTDGEWIALAVGR